MGGVEASIDWRRASEFPDQRRQLVGASRPSLMEAHFFVRLAVGDCPVAQARRVARLSGFVLKGEDRRHERLLRRLPPVQ